MKSNIHVTKTFLPPIEEYTALLRRAWDQAWLTNRGDLVLDLEKELQNFLDSCDLFLTNNGTTPLQIALKLLGRSGEIITTPFSYVATTSSILWENCKPVFVDIDKEHLTIDEYKIENAITTHTTAILATHVFGNPCNVEYIETIAKKYKLKVIYDAAHCFGVKYKGKSLFDYGDISTCSFHSTKLFHTGEGGALFCKDDDLMHKAYHSHNFGHNGPYEIIQLGINGKMSELQAALGLALLPYFDQIISGREKVVETYKASLSTHLFQFQKIREGTHWNYSYFPVIFKSETQLKNAMERLNEINVFPRRYFYPSLNNLNFIDNVEMPVSNDISSRVLCLPLYPELSQESVINISNTINKTIIDAS